MNFDNYGTIDNNDTERNGQPDLNQICKRIYPLIYLIMGIPELVNFFHFEDFFDDQYSGLIAIQEIMDTVRRCNSDFYNDAKEYSGTSINQFNLRNDNLVILQKQCNAKLSEIIEACFNDLHGYFSANNLSQDKSQCCLGHSLFNIKFTETQNNITIGKNSIALHNDFMYLIRSSFFNKVRAPLNQHRLENAQVGQDSILIGTSQIELQKYFIVLIDYQETIKSRTKLAQAFEEIFEENFLINSKHLITEPEQVKPSYYKINRIIYKDKNDAYSFLMERDDGNEWILYKDNSIKPKCGPTPVRSINTELVGNGFFPLFLILEKTKYTEDNAPQYKIERQRPKSQIHNSNEISKKARENLDPKLTKQNNNIYGSVLDYTNNNDNIIDQTLINKTKSIICHPPNKQKDENQRIYQIKPIARQQALSSLSKVIKICE